MTPLFAGIALVCALSASLDIAAATKPVTKPRAAAEPAQREIAYADLEKQLGKRIFVHTTLGTVRSGTLKKVTNISIDLKVDSGAELSIPANTIRSISVPVAPPDPLFPSAGEPSAKTK